MRQLTRYAAFPALCQRQLQQKPSCNTNTLQLKPYCLSAAMKAPLEESDVGISCYISPLPGFQGILKQRYSDFVVNEVDLSGNVVHLTSLEVPPEIAEESETKVTDQLNDNDDTAIESFRALAGDSDANSLKEFIDKISSDVEEGATSIVLSPSSDKVHRTAVHNFFKERLNFLVTDTVDGPEPSSKCIRVRLNSRGNNARDHGSKKRKGRGDTPYDSRGSDHWPDHLGKFLRFHLCKENKDTQEALGVIGKMLGIQPRSFGFSGTKDKRAVTTQQVTLFKQRANKLASLNKRLIGIKVGDFCYVNEGLVLGQLHGNRFTITLRGVVADSEDTVKAAADALGKHGFINYFGLQRFGTGSVPTHLIGAKLLRGEWKEAVSMILNPRDGEKDDIRRIREYYKESEDIDGTLRQLPRYLVAEKAIREDLQKVMELLSLTENHARTLLIHYRWDVDKVSQVFVNKGKDRLYEEACVTVHDNGDSSSLQSTSSTSCEICMEEVPVNKMTTMDCGHCFCNHCWTEYFLVKINEGQSRRISCMAHKCNVVCDEGKIRKNVSKKDPDLAKKFDRYILESYIEDNKRVKWCPSVPHCGCAIRVDYDEYCDVECACGVQFCFSCSLEAHSPCSCKMLELWNKKNKSGSDWIRINTKNCPKCHKSVIKDGGCNLVRCICGQPFCWLCGGATGLQHTWQSIDGHTCKEESNAKAARAKSDSLRYMHYLDRFKAHKDSLKAETALKKKLQSKISIMEARDKYTVDYSWVTNGADRLTTSRRILSYAYPFAYYMFGDVFLSEKMTNNDRIIKQNLFEQQQQQVESHIEKLSLFLAEPFDKYPEDKFKESKRKIITLSGVMDRLCKNLYDCVENVVLLDLGTTINIAPYRSKGADKAVELD